MVELSRSTDTLTETVCNAEPALCKADPKQVYNATVLYLFRGLNQKGYAARLRRLIGGQVSPNIKALTEALTSSGYIVKDYKVWLFYVVKNKLCQKDAASYAQQWKIKPADLWATLDLSRNTMAYLKRLSRLYAALTPEKLDQHLLNIRTNIKVWLGKFVSKKHRFVIQSQGMHRADVENELVYHGIKGLFNQYPLVESKLHAENVVKRVIHNQGINLIYKYTTQKNGRLTTEADGSHQARVIELSDVQMNTMIAETPNIDLQYDVRSFLGRLKQKQRRFVELLCGAYCERFTSWLKDRGHEVDTNEELLDRFKASRYVSLVLEHLNVSLGAGRRFMLKMQSVFSAYTTRSTTLWTALPAV